MARLTTGPGGGMTWNAGWFLQQLQRLGSSLNVTNSQFVRTQARLLVSNAAEATPISGKGFKERGRARAGWWPAAIALGSKSIFTKHANYSEGRVLDNSMSIKAPSVMIENKVPYIGRMIHGTAWFFVFAVGVRERQLGHQLKEAYQKQINKSGFGISGRI